jgi:hypothetical protein
MVSGRSGSAITCTLCIAAVAASHLIAAQFTGDAQKIAIEDEAWRPGEHRWAGSNVRFSSAAAQKRKCRSPPGHAIKRAARRLASTSARKAGADIRVLRLLSALHVPKRGSSSPGGAILPPGWSNLSSWCRILIPGSGGRCCPYCSFPPPRGPGWPPPPRWGPGARPWGRLTSRSAASPPALARSAGCPARWGRCPG